MIGLEQIQEELSQYKYKPGTTLSINTYDPEGYKLVISGYVPDTETGVSHEIRWTEVIKHEELLDSEFFTVGFPKHLRELILRLEIHEFQEWFQYNGKCVYDPHPELQRFRYVI